MRAFFLLLLLANLLFLAWVNWVAPERAPEGKPTPAATEPETVRMTSEVPLATELPVGPPPESPKEGAGCVSGGPFVQRPQADAAAERLKGLGFSSRLRTDSENIVVGEWVYIGSMASAEDANITLSTLQGAGLPGAEVVKDPELGTIVSVGVFSESAKTAAASQVVRSVGFEPKVKERRRPTPVFWIDIDRQANGSLPAVEMLIAPGAAPPPGPRLEFRACPANPAPAG